MTQPTNCPYCGAENNNRVIVAKPHPEYYLGTKKIEACDEPQECYPSTKQWGGQAWTFQSIEAAVTKFDELNALAEPPDVITVREGNIPPEKIPIHKATNQPATY
jgi:hypothetical protein